MQLYYYKDPIGNFGDDLNPWLWPQVFPDSMERAFDEDTLFVGIGSLLNQKIPTTPRKKKVFGTGFGYGELPHVDAQWTFYCVRGPLTAKLLSLPKHIAKGDSALLLRNIVEPASKITHRVSFMPHHQTSKYDDWKSVCDELGIQYLDPADSVEVTIQAIRTSSTVVTEAMHGAIVADALRVPWIPVRTRKRILDFKWQDWLGSLQMDHWFEWLTPAWSRDIDKTYKQVLHPISQRIATERLRWIIRYGRKRLSENHVLEDVYAKMRDAFDELIRDSKLSNRDMEYTQ